jgi:hypothetical protein
MMNLIKGFWEVRVHGIDLQALFNGLSNERWGSTLLSALSSSESGLHKCSYKPKVEKFSDSSIVSLPIFVNLRHEREFYFQKKRKSGSVEIKQRGKENEEA